MCLAADLTMHPAPEGRNVDGKIWPAREVRAVFIPPRWG